MKMKKAKMPKASGRKITGTRGSKSKKMTIPKMGGGASGIGGGLGKKNPFGPGL